MAEQLCITCYVGAQSHPTWPEYVPATTTVAGYALCMTCAQAAIAVLSPTVPAITAVLAYIAAHHP